MDRISRQGWRWMGGYARVKVEKDRIYAQLYERILPGKKVLDLGAGVGLLGLLLQERNQGNSVHGIEWDDRKVAFAQHLNPGDAPCQVHRGDITKDPWPPTDVVVLIDVLHYFPESVQKDLLQRIAKHLEPGGMLFLRVMNRDVKGRARLTRFLEWVAVTLRWNQASSVCWRRLPDVLDDLSASGLEATICSLDSHLLTGNCLISASRSLKQGLPKAP